MSLADWVSHEPVDLEEGVEKLLRFEGVEVMSLETGQAVVLRGPVDLTRYGAVEMTFTNPRTRMQQIGKGLRLLVSSEDGENVLKPWNILSVRAWTQLRGDLENGDYLKLVYGVTAVGQPPARNYQIRRLMPAEFPELYRLE